jgi:hypothetical protein
MSVFGKKDSIMARVAQELLCWKEALHEGREA